MTFTHFHQLNEIQMNSNENIHKKMRAVDKTLTSVPHKLLHVFQRSLYGKTRPCPFIAAEKKYSVRGTSSTIRRIQFHPPPDGQLVDKCWNTRQSRTVGHWKTCAVAPVAPSSHSFRPDSIGTNRTTTVSSRPYLTTRVRPPVLRRTLERKSNFVKR